MYDVTNQKLINLKKTSGKKIIMMEEIDTNISHIVIDGNIVRKTYTFQCDCVYHSACSNLTTELFIMNLLESVDGFPHIKDILLEPPKYTIVMDNLGKPVTKSDYTFDLFIKILRRMAVLHEHDIVHCDIKRGNILLDNQRNVSVIDFTHSFIMSNYDSTRIKKLGLNTVFEEDAQDVHTLGCTEVLTSYTSLAPESYGTSFNGKCIKNAGIDIWGLGCLLYELITGDFLFDGPKPHEGIRPDHRDCIKYMDIELMDVCKMLQKIDQIAGYDIEKKMMKMMLRLDPLKRPSATQLLAQFDIPYEVPKLYDVHHKYLYFYDSSRLRCWDFHPTLCMYIDRLVDRITNQHTNYTKYEVVCMVHLIVAAVFLDKDMYPPCEELKYGKNYMNLLTYIVKNIKFSVIYNEV